MMLLSNTSGVVSRFVVLHKHHCRLGYWISGRTWDKQPAGRRHWGDRWQMIDRKVRSGTNIVPLQLTGPEELVSQWGDSQVKTNCHMQSELWLDWTGLCASQPLQLFSSKLLSVLAPHGEIIIRDLRSTLDCQLWLFVSISICDKDLNLDSYLINTIFNHAGILSCEAPP